MSIKEETNPIQQMPISFSQLELEEDETKYQTTLNEAFVMVGLTLLLINSTKSSFNL